MPPDPPRGRYRVEIAPRGSAYYQGGETRVLLVDTRWADERERYGTTADEIAHAIAADYCDSGTVRVVNIDDPADRATVGRR